MNLFLFAKQFVDMLYPYRGLDYIMVFIALYMIGYQIVLARTDVVRNSTLQDYIFVLIAMILSGHFIFTRNGFHPYVKVLSAILIYFLGRICYERVLECNRALVSASYLIIYINFFYRLWKFGAGLLRVHDAGGDLYYYDADMAFAVILSTVFIAFLGKTTIYKLVTLLFISPCMVIFSEAGIQTILLFGIYGIILIYLVEKLLRKRKISSMLLCSLVIVLILSIIFVHLPVFGVMQQEWVAHLLTNSLIEGKNMFRLYQSWNVALQQWWNSGWPYRLLGCGVNRGIESIYIKTLYSTGIIGFVLSIYCVFNSVKQIKYVGERRMLYLMVACFVLFLGSGVMNNSLESTQMSWFPFLYMGVVASIAQEKKKGTSI